MYCLSLDYKTVDSNVRSKFSLTKREILDLSNKVGSLVALFTCNRSEIYFLCEPSLMLNVLDIPCDIKNLLCLYENDEAVKHLFSVTCGLESMLKGEDDIARQMKKAYYFSLENKISNKELNIAFQKAFNCSKRVKSETLLSKSATSFATLSSKYAKEYYKNNDCKGKILLVGATGELGSVIAKNIVSYNLPLTVTQRTCGGTIGTNYDTIPFEKRYDYLKNIDIVITATSSPHLIFDFDLCKDFIRQNQLFIDLSVPFDIDRRIEKAASFVDVDFFETLAKKNSIEKMKSVKQAEQIILEEFDEYKTTVKNNFERGKQNVLSNAV